MNGNIHLAHPRFTAIIGICLSLPLAVFGCRNHVPPDPTIPPEPQVRVPVHEEVISSLQNMNLAGTWEYHDGNVVYCVNLNQEGDGKYDWQGGRFLTTSLIDDRWQGLWFQKENDREGRFDLRLSENGHHAEGEWWYTRIADNNSPTQPGGRFALVHIPCSSDSETNMVSRPLTK